MSNQEYTQNLLNLIDDYTFKKTNNPNILEHISQQLNIHETFPIEIIDKFNTFIKRFHARKLDSLFVLLEYLSSHSTPSIQQLLKNQDFIEKLSSLSMEPGIQHKIMNLLRIWEAKFESDKLSMPELFNLIEFLESIGLKLPYSMMKPNTNNEKASSTQQPQHKNLNIDTTFKNEKKSNDKDQNEILDEIDQKVEKFIKDVDQIHQSSFEKNSCLVKISTIEGLIKQVENLLQELFTLVADNKDSNLFSKLDSSINNCAKNQEVLNQKLKILINERDTKSNSEPQMIHRSGSNKESKYSSNLSTINEAHSPITSNRIDDIFTWERFVNYKTFQCEYGINCQHVQTCISSNQTFSTGDYLCDGWHYSHNDKRRMIFSNNPDGDDDNHNQYHRQKFLKYIDKECPNKLNSCIEGDNCKFCHTNFEYLYHPNQYKRHKCKNIATCIKPNQCPYWHSPDEQARWNELIKIKLVIDRESKDDGENSIDFKIKDFKSINTTHTTDKERSLDSGNHIKITENKEKFEEPKKDIEMKTISSSGSIGNTPTNTNHKESNNNSNNTDPTYDKILTSIEIHHNNLISPVSLTKDFLEYPFYVRNHCINRDIFFNDELSNTTKDLIDLKEKYDLSKVNIASSSEANNTKYSKQII